MEFQLQAAVLRIMVELEAILPGVTVNEMKINLEK
jgi:hypothetical protein